MPYFRTDFIMNYGQIYDEGSFIQITYFFTYWALKSTSTLRCKKENINL